MATFLPESNVAGLIIAALAFVVSLGALAVSVLSYKRARQVSDRQFSLTYRNEVLSWSHKVLDVLNRAAVFVHEFPWNNDNLEIKLSTLQRLEIETRTLHEMGLLLFPYSEKPSWVQQQFPDMPRSTIDNKTLVILKSIIGQILLDVDAIRRNKLDVYGSELKYQVIMVDFVNVIRHALGTELHTAKVASAQKSESSNNGALV